MLLLSFVTVFSVGIFSAAETYRSCTWRVLPDHHIVGGEFVPASTVNGCQSVCLQTADCVSFDFVRSTNECYLLKSQENKQSDESVDHYDHVCIDVEPCSPNPCQNAGTCSESGESYECSCPTGYSGKNCESFNECTCSDIIANISAIQNTLETLRKQISRRDCPSGFDYLTGADACYRVIFKSLDWDGSSQECKRVMPGAHLAAITSEEKQQAVENYLVEQFKKKGSSACKSGKSVWSSGQTQDPKKCGTPYLWKTLNGAETPINYTNWRSGEPNCSGGNENCVNLNADWDYAWNDATCTDLSCVLCEF